MSAEECRCQGQATPHRPHASTLRAELDAAAAELAGAAAELAGLRDRVEKAEAAVGRVEALADGWCAATTYDDAQPDHHLRAIGAWLRDAVRGDQ